MSDQRGFTLIEVLIAFAILSIVLISLYQAAGTGLRAYDRAAEMEQAVLVAQSQLDRIVSLKRIPDQREGRVTNSPFSWKVSVLPVPTSIEKLSKPLLQPSLVRLTVKWETNRATKSISVDRLIFPPTGPR